MGKRAFKTQPSQESSADQIPNVTLLSAGRSKSFGASVSDWYQHHQRSLPWRDLWRRFRNPYHVWLSEIMLQQTVIKAVIPKYQEFVTALPTVDALALASSDEIKRLVAGLGYYRRFNFMHLAAKQIVHDSRASGHLRIDWPKSSESWKRLPGIGDYTAAAISSICLDEACGVVDGNVERIFCRILDLRLPPNLPRLKPLFKSQVALMIHDAPPADFNQGLMELGQTICTPTSPKCEVCPVSKFCLAYKRQSQAEAPAPKLKKSKVDVTTETLILFDPKALQVGLVQRAQNARFLAGQLGLATFVESVEPGSELAAMRPDGLSELCLPIQEGRYLGMTKHTITNHRIKNRVSMLAVPAARTKRSPHWAKHVSWVHRDLVSSKLVTSFDQKAWKLFCDASTSLAND